MLPDYFYSNSLTFFCVQGVKVDSLREGERRPWTEGGREGEGGERWEEHTHTQHHPPSLLCASPPFSNRRTCGARCLPAAPPEGPARGAAADPRARRTRGPRRDLFEPSVDPSAPSCSRTRGGPLFSALVAFGVGGLILALAAKPIAFDWAGEAHAGRRQARIAQGLHVGELEPKNCVLRRGRLVSRFGKKNEKSTTWKPRTRRRSVGSRPSRGRRSARTSLPRRARTARWKGAG